MIRHAPAPCRKPVLLALLLLASACSGGDAPSAEDNRELDAADRLLDEAPAQLEDVDDRALEEKGNAGP